MALPIRPNNPNIPIPNTNFSAPLNPYLRGPWFPFVAGSGIDLNTPDIPAITSDVSATLAAGSGITLTTSGGITTISATGGGGGGSGTVTSITAGTGLTGGTITTAGTIALTNTGVPPGSYTSANITVDAQGRITAASNGSGTVTSITAGSGLTGGTITTTGTIALSNTGVTPGSYTGANITVDAQGRITAASNGGGSVVPPATPTVEGIVFGCTDSTNFNYGLGDNIFSALTTGTFNIAIGTGALASTGTGTSNTAIGIGALFSNTSGTQNVALGQQALFANTTEGLNTAIGSQALQSTTGGANTALGNFAGNLVTTGCSNILIGNQAGGVGAGALDTGNNNVIIGNCVAPVSNSADCQLAIGVGTMCWLTGYSTGDIEPGAGIIDCAGSLGTAGQVLCSTGSAIQWASPSSSSSRVFSAALVATAIVAANQQLVPYWATAFTNAPGFSIGTAFNGCVSSAITAPIGCLLRIDYSLAAALDPGGFTGSTVELQLSIVNNATGLAVPNSRSYWRQQLSNTSTIGQQLSQAFYLTTTAGNCSFALQMNKTGPSFGTSCWITYGGYGNWNFTIIN